MVRIEKGLPLSFLKASLKEPEINEFDKSANGSNMKKVIL